MLKIGYPFRVREMMPTSSVSMNEGHFTWIISKFNNQQNWEGETYVTI